MFQRSEPSNPPRRSAGSMLLLALLLSACTGLDRELNQALPEFLRADPGEKEMEIFKKVRQTREWTPEDLAAQDAAMDSIRVARGGGDHDDAVVLLTEYLEEYPGSQHDEEARYALGDSYYQNDEWERAFNVWKEFTLLYPVSDYNVGLTSTLYEVGNDFVEGRRASFFGIFSRKTTGIKVLNHLIETFPSSPRAADAQWAIANHHLNDESWPEAEGSFQFLTEKYESSEWYNPSLYYVAYARYRQVKGVVYDPQTMRRAQEAFERYLVKVPEGEWSAEAKDSVAQLTELRAAHELSIGEWYMKMDKPYSARHYLLSTMTRFPDTTAAARAEEILPQTPSVSDGTEIGPEVPAGSIEKSVVPEAKDAKKGNS